MTTEGDKGGAGRVCVGEDDMGDRMQCSNHPYRTNPGGICAFCLQEKLGKLVSSSSSSFSSSSFPLPIRGSSSSSSASFRSDTAAVVANSSNGVVGTTSTSLSLSLSVHPTSTITMNENGHNGHDQEYYPGRARIPFLSAKKKKKIIVASSDHHHAATDVFKRSKSTTTPWRGRFLDASVDDGGEDFSPRKRGGFWSFLYLSSKSNDTKRPDKIASIAATSTTAIPAAAAAAGGATTGSVVNPKENCLGSSLSRKGSIVVVDDDDSSNSQDTSCASSFERKVSRSRSVGCGSSSFSGDFFERISTGVGDCTVRRVESQREGKPKVAAAAAAASSSAVKERFKCGGLLGGFVLTSSSSSSSSSYWVSNTGEDVNGRSTAGALVHGRNKSWGWAFASPMRAFNKSSTSSGKRDIIIRESNNKSSTPNLAAIPSLLAVRV